MPSPPWTGAPCLELVHEFNERFIEGVVEAARANDGRSAPEMVRRHRDLWANLDAAARLRASRCPFLLVDIQFRNAAWWRQACNDAAWQSDPPGSARLFPRTRAVELARDALIVAWRTAQHDTRVAATLLAMSEEVAGIVATLGLGHLRDIPDHHHRHLRPRWEGSSSFWGRLACAAGRDDREALSDVHLYAVQLADADMGFAGCAANAAAVVRD